MLTIIVHSCRKIFDLRLFSQEIGSALNGLKFGFEFLNQNVKAQWGRATYRERGGHGFESR